MCVMRSYLGLKGQLFLRLRQTFLLLGILQILDGLELGEQISLPQLEPLEEWRSRHQVGLLLNDGSARKIDNSGGLTIGSAASTISSTHIGLWDASSGGNFIARAVAPYSFISGTSYSIAIGDLEFILD